MAVSASKPKIEVETNDWYMRVGDGINFMNSSKHYIWGVKSYGKNLFANMKRGDRVWFIQCKSKGKIIGVATYISNNKRIVNITATNKELGWRGEDNEWDTEIHYRDLYILSDRRVPLLTHIKSCQSIAKYYKDKCTINLPLEYSYIVQYCKVL
jgi:acid phosphatase class B